MSTPLQIGISILGQPTLDSISYLLHRGVSASDLINISADQINTQASKLKQQTIDNEQSRILSIFKRRFPNSVDILYEGYVFHGQYQIHDRIEKGLNIFMGDVSNILMKLYDVGVIEPKQFRPSHSGAAFLGLDKCNHGLANDKEPNCTSAAHWEWEVLVDTQFELTLDETLEENGWYAEPFERTPTGEAIKNCFNSKGTIVFTGTCRETWAWLKKLGVAKEEKSNDDLEPNILRWMILDSVAGSHPHPGCKHDILDHEAVEKLRMKITSSADEKKIRQTSKKIIDELQESRLDLLGYGYGDGNSGSNSNNNSNSARSGLKFFTLSTDEPLFNHASKYGLNELLHNGVELKEEQLLNNMHIGDVYNYRFGKTGKSVQYARIS